MREEERIKRVEEAIEVMKDLLVNHSEQLETYFKALRESRDDFEFKMDALIDSQLRSESEIIEIKESIRELGKISESSLKRIEKLEIE